MATEPAAGGARNGSSAASKPDWSIGFWSGRLPRAQSPRPSRLCAAIFDRAAGALSATSLGSLADPHNAGLLAELLDTYDFALIDSTTS